MKNGETVAAFERAFAAYVGARYAIALCNGTATLHTALIALGVKPGDRVAVPPLTMSATTLAVLHAGAVPVFCDVDRDTWLMADRDTATERDVANADAWIPVSLYGLHQPWKGERTIDDAAQTLRPHSGCAFTSYSFQASKILALGEGGMLVTNDEQLATRAREFSSLGYRMRADQPRIDPAMLKSPTFERHHSIGYNYRMNDLTAAEGLRQLDRADALLQLRQDCANFYRDVLNGTSGSWISRQFVPLGCRHDYWTFAIACDTPNRAFYLANAVRFHGGEQPFPAWRLSHQEPALQHLAPGQVAKSVRRDSFGVLAWPASAAERESVQGACPVAESLQPRILQFQTNNLESAERNAAALRRAISDLQGASH